MKAVHNDWASSDWNDVRYFLAASRFGSFGAAARQLHVEQSTLSRRVAALEARLGGVLFDRRSTGLMLTEMGSLALESAISMEEALMRISDCSQANSQGTDGMVRIATTETMASFLVVPKVLPKLFRDHPKLLVDLVIGDLPVDLARREADIAIRFFLPPKGDFVIKKVARIETAVLGKASMVRAWKAKPFRDWPFIGVWIPGAQSAQENWRKNQGGTNVRLTSNSFQSQLEALRNGLGFGVVPRAIVETHGLVEMKLGELGSPPPLDAYLVVPRPLRKVPRVAAAFGALEETFAKVFPRSA